jgi:hexosaminidase
MIFKILCLLAVASATPLEVYWWKYPNVDCDRVDVVPQPACAGPAGTAFHLPLVFSPTPFAAKGDVETLKKCCLATAGCAGFNTHNVIKAAGCRGTRPVAGCDLYLKEDQPQPPPPPTPKPYPAPPSQRQSVGLWPLPRNMTNSFKTVSLASNFALSIVNGSTPTLEAVAKRYNQLILLHGPPAASTAVPTLHECTINVTSSTEELSTGMDESYTLDVGVNGGGNYASCKITAGTFVGAMYGAETLSQLVLGTRAAAGSGAVYTIPQAPWHIEDAPRFPFRGLMVDTARHFLPLNALRRQIDGMSFSKMNVLHSLHSLYTHCTHCR